MKKIDLPLLIVTFILTLFGLVMIYNASSFIAFRDFSDKYHYIKDQSLWMILGFTFLCFFSFFNYQRFYNLALPIILGGIFLLILVFVPGLGVYVMGARRWVNFHFFTIQPGEVVKLGLAIYLAAWFSTKEKGRLLAFLLLLGLIIFLVMLQPDMGTAAVVLAEALVIYFISGASVLYFALMAPALSLLALLLIKIEPYRASRLTAFLNVSSSLENSSYHVKQILISLGMGGLTGVGIGNSLQKYAYLPENTTDSIFAIIAEEFGFLGSTVMIVLFMLLVWRGFVIAGKSKTLFGRLLAGGISTFLGVQIIINLGAQTALLPLTGIPLPFISYGGSALVINLCSIGILLNISKDGYI